MRKKDDNFVPKCFVGSVIRGNEDQISLEMLKFITLAEGSVAWTVMKVVMKRRGAAAVTQAHYRDTQWSPLGEAKFISA